MGMLSEHDRELIYCLLRSQDMFELPREEDIQQVTVRGYTRRKCLIKNVFLYSLPRSNETEVTAKKVYY